MRKTGRTLLVNGGARLEFAPQLSVRLDDVFLSNPEGMEGNFARAASAHLPLQLSDLIRRKLKIRSIALDQPVFSFLVDRDGHSNWVSEGKERTGEARQRCQFQGAPDIAGGEWFGQFP